MAKRGFSQLEIDGAQERLRLARNVASHGSDAVLLDLGYPVETDRPISKQKQLRGEDLAFSALASDLAPVRFAIRWALAQLFERMRECDWDDAVFESGFE